MSGVVGVVRNYLVSDFSWVHAAKEYEGLYTKVRRTPS